MHFWSFGGQAPLVHLWDTGLQAGIKERVIGCALKAVTIQPIFIPKLSHITALSVTFPVYILQTRCPSASAVYITGICNQRCDVNKSAWLGFGETSRCGSTSIQETNHGFPCENLRFVGPIHHSSHLPYKAFSTPYIVLLLAAFLLFTRVSYCLDRCGPANWWHIIPLQMVAFGVGV